MTKGCVFNFPEFMFGLPINYGSSMARTSLIRSFLTYRDSLVFMSVAWLFKIRKKYSKLSLSELC